MIASDHPGDALAGDAAVVVQLGGAAGDPGRQVGFVGELGGVAVELLVEPDRAGRVEAVVGDDQHRRRLAAAVEVDRFVDRLAGRRRRPVEGREDEVAGVEEPGGRFGDLPGLMADPVAAGEDLDARFFQPGFQRRAFLDPVGQRRSAALRRRPPSWSRPPTSRRGAAAERRDARRRGAALRGRGGRRRRRACCCRACSSRRPSSSWSSARTTFSSVVLGRDRPVGRSASPVPSRPAGVRRAPPVRSAGRRRARPPGSPVAGHRARPSAGPCRSPPRRLCAPPPAPRRSSGSPLPTVIASSCARRRLRFFFGDLRRRDQLRQLLVGVFVQRLSAACPSGGRRFWRSPGEDRVADWPV